jgi:hypothetical protein
MRRIIVISLAVALLMTAVWAVRGAAARSDRTAAAAAPAAARQHAAGAPAVAAEAPPAGAMTAHQHDLAALTATTAAQQRLARQLARARLATARYATNLGAANAAGYRIITRDVPDMGWHFLNPTVHGFQVTKPHVLVYQRHRHTWQLAALEWVFPTKPATPPLPGATYGSFAAACHYADGTFLFRTVQEKCPSLSPESGAPFGFWHPDLVTLHVWLWYPNPSGLYDGTNPYVRPFNRT